MRKVFFAAAVALAGFVAAARAQDYPRGTTRIIVPLGAGGALDTIVRGVAGKLQERFGQPVIVENITGGGTLIAAQTLARAAPDGLTLLAAPSGLLTTNVTLFKQLPYDPVKDFTPVSHYAEIAFVLVVNPDLPIKSIPDLVRLAKEKPGALSYSSTGIGQVPHLAGEILARATGTELTHVPYRGSPQALADVIGGHVSMNFADPSVSRELIADGKIRALGVSSRTRLSFLPDTPTLIEAGVPGYEAVSWHMLLAPAGTPKPVVQRLHEEWARAIAAPDIRAQMERMGVSPVDSEPIDLLPAFQARELAKWSAIVKQVGIAGTQ
jgi:tripartite-type tricarboxylate transporter receptor subunit TctC